MKRFTLVSTVLALVGALAVVALATPAGAARKRTCGRAAGSTLIWDAGYRVFSKTTRSRTDRDANTVRLYACRSGRTTIKRLDTFRNNLDGKVELASFDIVGRWVLVRYRFETGVQEGFGAARYALDGSVPVFRYDVGVVDAGPGVKIVDSDATVGGGVAFLTEGGTVLGFDATGQHVLEATGAKELATDGDRVFWTKADGTPGSAVLNGVAVRTP